MDDITSFLKTKLNSRAVETTAKYVVPALIKYPVWDTVMMVVGVIGVVLVLILVGVPIVRWIRGWFIQDNPRKIEDANRSTGEFNTLQALKQLFPNHSFQTIRPDWLINPETGARMEIDLCCPELGLAVEYDGEQHSRWVPDFQRSYADFMAQRRRDSYKDEQVARYGYALIRVPYTLVQQADIRDYLIRALEQVKTHDRLAY